MAGGHKNFGAETLVSGDVDNYLMRQSMMRFTSVSNRNSELTGILEQGMWAVTLDTDSVWYYDGSAWVAVWTPWTTYTPAWTNLTLNSGTVNSARYQYLFGNLYVRGEITFAADTSVTGIISQTLPDGVTSDAGWAGQVGLARDDSGNVFEPAIIGIQPSSTAFSWVSTRTGTNFDNTVPWTWAVSDKLTWDFRIAI